MSEEEFLNNILNWNKEDIVDKAIKLRRELLEKREEIERLKLELSGYRQAILQDKEMLGLKQENERLHSIIKEVREYIEEKYNYILGDDTFLDHDERIDRKQIKHILEILDKENI